MKILILGASGFLGNELYNYFKNKYECIGTQSTKIFPELISVDLTDKEKLKKLVNETKPDIIINCLSTRKIGLDRINFCEKYPEEAYKINSEIIKNLTAFQGKIVLFSTAAVFSGEKGNYTEEDKPNPINIYGKSKLEGEKTLQNKKNYLIIRTGTLYKDKTGFIYNILKEGKEIEAFTNIYDCPIDITEIPEFLENLIKKQAVGIFHISGKRVSKFDFALEIAKKHNFNKKLIKPLTYTSNLIPLDTSLKSVKLK